MSKQSQHVLIALPHPLLHLVSLGLVSFIFTLFSLELSQFGTQLAPLWFPTSIMMVAFYRHAGRMWPGIALSCSLGNIAASILLFSTSSLNMTWTTINIVEAVAFYFHYCAVDVERRAPATNGSLFDLPYHGDDGVTDDGR